MVVATPIIIVCLRFPWYVLFERFPPGRRPYGPEAGVPPFAFQASGFAKASTRQVGGQAGFKVYPVREGLPN